MNQPLSATGSLLIWLLLGSLLSGCAAVVVGGVVAGVAITRDRRTTGTVVEDESIEIKAGDRLRSDAEIAAQAHINVTSYNLEVLLTGEAPTEELRARAGELVRGVEKVTRVYNEIVIAAPSAMSARSSDGWITTKVKTSLFDVEVPDFDPSRVKVVTERGVVYLMGLVTRQEAEAATEVVRRVGGVQRVVRLFQYLD
jgi:osmotically-inducible protein OsmY